MFESDAGDPKRIQHFTKVHGFAHLIAVEEGIDEKKRNILEIAALVHDIGIRYAKEQYGYQNGKLQEEIGPAYARKLLEEIGIQEETISRVEFLVGHHHTYQGVDDIDWQILLEADFLVNSFEGKMSRDSIINTVEKVFQTESGRKLCQVMYRLSDKKEGLYE